MSAYIRTQPRTKALAPDFAQLNRRGFIVASATVCIGTSFSTFALPVDAAAHYDPQLLTDWSIDDMWTGYPRPSQTIGFAPASVSNERLANAGSAAPGSIEALFG